MITTEAGGEDKPEEREQLDVKLDKLLGARPVRPPDRPADWLLDRKIVPRDWNNRLQAVRAKIGKALEGIPATAQLGTLPSASDLTYSHCRRVIELLSKTESSEKGMFGWGGYKSQAMNDWATIVADYQKSGLLLTELCQRLSQAVDFELCGRGRAG